MNKSLKIALWASSLAILISTSMDATGLVMFSALPLIGLLLIFSWLATMGRRELGFVIGVKQEYLPALIIPVLLIALVSGLAFLTGAVNIAETDWQKTWSNIAIMGSVGILLVAITEEGFFRGLLWGLFERAGFSSFKILMLTTFLFMLWHLSAVLIATEYAPPMAQVPIYLVNGSLLGFIWGAMRQLSGSIWPSTIYHSTWNALAYEFFGFGERTGALGIVDSWLYGPEIGLAGIAVNSAVAVYCFRKMKSQ